MAALELKNVYKTYNKNDNIIKNVNLSITSGELMVFVGPSGCGKSTLLRMIAGLEDISQGDIYIDNELINDISPAKRGIAMVFQSYALYPHMSVYDNMAFSLKLAKLTKNEIDQAVRRASSILQIDELLNRLPKQLSGGQRQRVAIGRAIVRNPKVFLFDEPLSNLDAALRAQTRIEIANLHNALDSTMVYVTHDQTEAMTLADRIVVLNSGEIEQVGTPSELYHQPQTKFVAGFIGNSKMNFFTREHLNITEHPDAVTFGIRPEHLILSDSEVKGSLAAKLIILEQLGEYTLAYVELSDGTQVTAKIDSTLNLTPQQSVYLTLDMDKLHCFNHEHKRVN